MIRFVSSTNDFAKSPSLFLLRLAKSIHPRSQIPPVLHNRAGYFCFFCQPEWLCSFVQRNYALALRLFVRRAPVQLPPATVDSVVDMFYPNPADLGHLSLRVPFFTLAGRDTISSCSASQELSFCRPLRANS